MASLDTAPKPSGDSWIDDLPLGEPLGDLAELGKVTQAHDPDMAWMTDYESKRIPTQQGQVFEFRCLHCGRKHANPSQKAARKKIQLHVIRMCREPEEYRAPDPEEPPF